jgi:hypothetical protein
MPPQPVVRAIDPVFDSIPVKPSETILIVTISSEQATIEDFESLCFK